MPEASRRTKPFFEECSGSRLDLTADMERRADPSGMGAVLTLGRYAPELLLYS